MRTLGVWFLIVSSTASITASITAACTAAGTKGSGGRPPSPPPPTLPGATIDAPMAGEQACPAGTEARTEPMSPGETLRSCVVPGREYRTTPFRHGPYQLVGDDGRLRFSGQWVDNKEDGVWRWWHPNGKLGREMTYQAGQPQTDASWDDAGRPIDRRGPDGATTWYPNGNKKEEWKKTSDGTSIDTTSWFENGQMSKQQRTLDGQSAATSEWFENGQKKEEFVYTGAKMTSWHGWSSTGHEITDSSCVEDADCTAGVKNECYRCSPPYEPITRWEAAQRIMHPPKPPTGCDPGPFPCKMPPGMPASVCQSGRCTFNGLAP